MIGNMVVGLKTWHLDECLQAAPRCIDALRLQRDAPTIFQSQQATVSWTTVLHKGHALTLAAQALQSTRCLHGSSSALRSADKHTMHVILSDSVFALAKRASSRARCMSRTVTKRVISESSSERSCSSERECRAA